MIIQRRYILMAAALCAATPAFATGAPAEEAAPAGLTITKSGGGALLLAWEDAGPRGLDDPAIYEGSLVELRRGHWDMESVDCSTGVDHREEILPTPGSRYYLVVPRSDKRRVTIQRGSQRIERGARPTPCTLRRKRS